MSKFIKNTVSWFGGLFDSNSSVSSKRFVGIMLVFWACIMGSYYIWKVQHGGDESTTTVSLLEFAIVSAVGLLAGGTAAEALKRHRQKKDEEGNN